MRRAAARLCATVLASVVAIGGVSAIDPEFAFAQECVGVDERLNTDFSDVHHLVMIDSCKALELVDAYGNVKDTAGLAAMLGAKWWPVGVSSAALFGWAWNNQAQVRGAARAGQGVEFVSANGVIMRARPQR